MARFLLVLAALALPLTASAVTAGPKAVVELFTSQGCSSCPPADKVLADLAADADVLALAWHVDYWDALGWRDTLGSPAATARQRAYAAARGDGRIYTPQAVVNGDGHLVGSDRAGVQRAVAGASLPVALSIETGFAGVTLRVPASPDGIRATLRLVAYRPRAEVVVERGENAGRTILYANAVMSSETLGQWGAEPAAFAVPRSRLSAGDDVAWAAILQEETPGGPGRVLGAALLPAGRP